MSAFLRVERFGSEPRVVNLRGIYGTLGEDALGVLSCHTPARPFFSVGSVEHRHLVRFETGGFSVNGATIEQFGQVWVETGDVIEGRDYRFTLAFGSSAAEAWAYSTSTAPPLTEEIPTFPHLEIQLSGLSKSIPLFPGIDLTIGRADSNCVVVNLDSVCSKHCQVTNRSSDIVVQPLEGDVSVNSQRITGATPVTRASTFKIEPVGVVVRVV